MTFCFLAWWVPTSPISWGYYADCIYSLFYFIIFLFNTNSKATVDQHDVVRSFVQSQNNIGRFVQRWIRYQRRCGSYPNFWFYGTKRRVIARNIHIWFVLNNYFFITARICSCFVFNGNTPITFTFHIFLGFEKPSAIQQRSIQPIVKGRDVIAQAQSGTGKTATFSISILQSLDTTLRETQVLVLSPTRELATQIQKVILALGDFMNVQCHACIGGTNLGEDIRKLDYGQHVVSGTPGRVFGKKLLRHSSLLLWLSETIKCAWPVSLYDAHWLCR